MPAPISLDDYRNRQRRADYERKKAEREAAGRRVLEASFNAMYASKLELHLAIMFGEGEEVRHSTGYTFLLSRYRGKDYAIGRKKTCTLNEV